MYPLRESAETLHQLPLLLIVVTHSILFGFCHVLNCPCITLWLITILALSRSRILFCVALHVHRWLYYCAFTFLFGTSSFHVATLTPVCCAAAMTLVLVVFPFASLVFFLTFFQAFIPLYSSTLYLENKATSLHLLIVVTTTSLHIFACDYIVY